MNPEFSAWHVIEKVEELRGEERANVFRILGAFVFYAIELINYHGVKSMGLMPVLGVTEQMHGIMTAIAAGTFIAATVGWLFIRNQIFPQSLKYISTTFDFVFASCALMIADGPQSPLVVILFVLLVLAALRMNARLIIFSTVVALSSYVAVYCAYYYFRAPISFHYLLITLTSLGIEGLVLTRLVKNTKEMAKRLSEARDEVHVPDGVVK